MNKGTVYLFLADGFEEVEALAPLDILRRGKVEVVTVGITARVVNGSHLVSVNAEVDGSGGFLLPEDAAMVVLPGGPGVANLKKSATVVSAVKEAERRGIYIAAICAAPTLLADHGLLNGKRATAFPDYEDDINAVGTYTGAAVEVDGNIITGRSMGVAARFGKTLLETLRGEELANAVIHNIYPEEQY